MTWYVLSKLLGNYTWLWPEAKLEIIPDAGHSASEVGIARALRQATDSFVECC